MKSKIDEKPEKYTMFLHMDSETDENPEEKYTMATKCGFLEQEGRRKQYKAKHAVLDLLGMLRIAVAELDIILNANEESEVTLQKALPHMVRIRSAGVSVGNAISDWQHGLDEERKIKEIWDLYLDQIVPYYEAEERLQIDQICQNDCIDSDGCQITGTSRKCCDTVKDGIAKRKYLLVVDTDWG